MSAQLRTPTGTSPTLQGHQQSISSMSMLHGGPARDVVLPFILLMVGIPLLQVIFVRYWVAVHQIVLLDGIDVDTEVLSHKTNSKAMGESTNLVGFASHGTVKEGSQE